MALPAWLGAVRKVLGKITDLLTLGRSAGLWSKNNLKGSRTLILLVLANLTQHAIPALERLASGSEGSLAGDLLKAVVGFVAVLTVSLRFMPEEKRND